jgi:hypothetical protein
MQNKSPPRYTPISGCAAQLIPVRYTHVDLHRGTPLLEQV